MLVPNDLRYSTDHQWVRAEGDFWRVGITDFAQDALGEVTMVQVVAVDATIATGEEMGEIEAFKAMTDLYMPAEAVVVEHNPALTAAPTAVNTDPYGTGWLCIVRPVANDALDDLLDADGYRAPVSYTHLTLPTTPYV